MPLPHFFTRSRDTIVDPSPALNLGYRVADDVHEFREQHAQKAGNPPVIVPFVGYGSTRSVRVLGRALYRTQLFSQLSEQLLGDQRATSPARGWRSFTSVPISYAQVSIELGGERFEVTSDRSGVIDVELSTTLEPGTHEVTMTLPGGDPVFSSVYVVPDGEKYGIICDIDDTVMVTALPRPALAAWNSFVISEHARMPTPGMAVFLDRLHRAHPHAPVMYLSTGPWNAAPTLRRFLSRNAYPEGTLLLTDWGPTRTRWFRNGTGHKVNSLRRLVKEFPDIKWILIGDDGQRDPDIYSGFALRYPEHVAAIVIRNLTVGESVLASGRVWGDDRAKQVASGGLWMEANDGASLSDKLKRFGLL